jgi:alkylation response protein AidB-like acyl-CoA dehydrogenase
MMHFDFTPEQQLLSDMVQKLLAQEYSFEARARILASEEGTSRPLWGRLAEMGVLALQVPEAYDGMAPATVETMLTMNALGKALVVEPYLSSAILGTALLRELGSPEQLQALLPAMAMGEQICVSAHAEPEGRYHRSHVATTAERASDGWRLDGHKAVVLHAPVADVLLVTARTAGALTDEQGISVFLLPKGAGGVTLVSYPTADGQRAAEVKLDNVCVGEDALLGREGGAFPVLDAVLDLGTAALCAEAVGVLQATLDATTLYTQERKQFGVPIAKFQALQHRMAEMLIHVEQARSMSYLAAVRATDSDVHVRRRAISAAKVVVGRACRYVGENAVQLHGGMGMTDELVVSHYFKRLFAIDASLGDIDYHLERFIGTGAAAELEVA